MFTGIVSDIGEVTAREDGRFTIRTRYPAQEAGGRRLDGLRRLLPDHDVGARRRRAAACSRSTCRTRRAARRPIGDVAAGPQNQSRAFTAARSGARRALVAGHVDGLARIVGVVPDGESRRFSFEVAEHLAPLYRPERVR